MRALILAAGDGDRLHPFTHGAPKALVPLDGRPIISHVLDALASGGANDATIVVGYRAAQMRSALADLCPSGMTMRFVENPDYQLGNARSLWAAREAMLTGGDFVLVMADHLILPELIAALLRDATNRCRLAIDRAAPGDPRAVEATRALVRDGRVVELGKALDEWNALDTGAFWCTPQLFDAITPPLRDGEAGAVFATLARAGELDAVDVTGTRWIDIDTAADLHAAEALIASGART
jgi:choline kinase